MVIDARIHHDPAKAPGLVQAAIQACGTQAELSQRLGVSKNYLITLKKGGGNMTYPLQVALECIVKQG